MLSPCKLPNVFLSFSRVLKPPRTKDPPSKLSSKRNQSPPESCEIRLGAFKSHEVLLHWCPYFLRAFFTTGLPSVLSNPKTEPSYLEGQGDLVNMPATPTSPIIAPVNPSLTYSLSLPPSPCILLQHSKGFGTPVETIISATY